MNKLKKLLEYSKNIWNLYRKLKTEKELKLLKELLEEEIEKETELLEKLDFNELTYLERILNEMDLNKNGLDILHIIINRKSYPPYILRTLRKIKQNKNIYLIQENTNLKKEELYSILENPHIEEIRKSLELWDNFERKVRISFLKKEKQNETLFNYIFEDSMENMLNGFRGILKDSETDFEDLERFEDIILENIKELIEDYLKNGEMEKMSLLISLLEYIPETIKFSLGSYCESILRIDNTKTKQIKEVLEMFEIEIIETNDWTKTMKIPQSDIVFTYEQIVKFDGIYKDLFENSQMLWKCFKGIIESVSKKEPIEEREYLKEYYKKYLKKETEILKNINQVEEFQDYINLVYGEEKEFLPTSILLVAESSHPNPNLKEIQIVEDFLLERLKKIINSLKNEKEEYTEEEELLDLKTSDDTIEKFMEITARKNLGLITKKEYLEELEKIGFFYEEEQFEQEQLFIKKMFSKIDETFEENLKNLLKVEEQELLKFLLYAKEFMNNNFKIVENDLQIEEKSSYTKIDLKSPFYPYFVVITQEILLEEFKIAKDFDELYKEVLELYVDALLSNLKKEDRNNLEHLLYGEKRIKNKK